MKKILRLFCLMFAGFLLFVFSSITNNNIFANNLYGKLSPIAYCSYSNISSKNYGNFYNIQNVSSMNKKNAKTSDIMVYPGGKSLGIKISTKGALVIALCDIEAVGEKIKSPALTSGIAVGDSIMKIDGKEVSSSEDIATLVNRCDGKDITVLVERKGKEMSFKVMPVMSKNDDKYKIGLWVRDSAAGVGTLTFYDDEKNIFGALGHPITDVDTGSIMTINKGEVVSSNVVSIKRGVRGNPGELRGVFTNSNGSLGKIVCNTECGVFGKGNNGLISKKFNKKLKVAFKEEVKVGKAQIITTIEGEEPELFDVLIERVINQEEPSTKSMVIKIIDPRCLEKTGGIVQGMSGSPIIQNGKIVGAVTHVLVNKPDTGYGIYMDWMIEKSNSVK